MLNSIRYGRGISMSRILLVVLSVMLSTVAVTGQPPATGNQLAKDLLRQADAAWSRGDWEGAKELYRRAAITGDAEAEYHYGLDLIDKGLFDAIYDKEKGIKDDPEEIAVTKEGVEWLLKSATQGYVPAMVSLAGEYRSTSGQGPNPWLENDVEAFKWYMKAAGQGNTHAEYSVASMLEKGLGVKQDSAAAIQWYQKAAAQSDEFAKDALIRLAPAANDPIQQAIHNGLVAEDKNDSEAAQKYYREAAQLGSADAQYRLARILSDLAGIASFMDKNNAGMCSEIQSWLEKSANQGFVKAMDSLGHFYGEDWCHATDQQKARMWYQKAAEKGNDDGQFNLGWIYQKGLGVAKDMGEAAKWYRKAAAQGEEHAISALAQMQKQ